MAKFNEFDDYQKDAYKEFMFLVIQRKMQEETTYLNQVFRFLILGNGTGILLLAAFMGAVAGAGNPISELVSPLWTYFIGAFFAAIIYVPLLAVASQATIHTVNQISDFFQNKLDLDHFQNYGLTRKGILLIQFLAFISLLMFFVGTYQCVSILETI